jgi:hypothetical protein
VDDPWHRPLITTLVILNTEQLLRHRFPNIVHMKCYPRVRFFIKPLIWKKEGRETPPSRVQATLPLFHNIMLDIVPQVAAVESLPTD